MRALFAAIVIILGLGCKRSDPLVGTWVGSIPAKVAVGGQARSNLTLTQSGRFTNVTTMTIPSGSGMTSTDTGTWKLVKGVLVLNFDDVDWEFTGSARRVAAARAKFLAQKTKILEKLKSGPSWNIVSQSDDSFTVIDASGRSVTYRRAK